MSLRKGNLRRIHYPECSKGAASGAFLVNGHFCMWHTQTHSAFQREANSVGKISIYPGTDRSKFLPTKEKPMMVGVSTKECTEEGARESSFPTSRAVGFVGSYFLCCALSPPPSSCCPPSSPNLFLSTHLRQLISIHSALSKLISINLSQSNTSLLYQLVCSKLSRCRAHASCLFRLAFCSWLWLPHTLAALDTTKCGWRCGCGLTAF